MDAVRKTTIAIALLMCGMALHAQQMNWARLAEDTVYYAREYNPEKIFMMLPGPAQIWDFRSVRAPYALSRRIIVSGGDQGVTGQLVNGNQLDAILQLKGSTSLITQIIEDNPICRSEKLTYQLTPGYKPFFKGVLGEDFSYRGRMIATFHWPKHMSCAWTPTQLPDSCRITYTIQEDIQVDGEGTLYLPTEISSAYRQHVTTKKAAKVEIKYGIFWRDVTTQVPGIRLITNMESYRYVSADMGMTLAEIHMKEDDQPLYIEFKTHPVATRIFTAEPDRPDIYAFPNPSFDIVRFQLTDLAFGKYRLRIYNILGSPIRELEVTVDDSRETVSMDLGDLQRGTYLYRLIDSHGRTIKTKRVVLIQA